MALFVVSYDLVKRKDYQTLWDEFTRLGGQKVLDSMYLIELDNTSQEVVKHFSQYVDDDDRLMAIEFSEKPRFTKALVGTRAWINKHFP